MKKWYMKQQLIVKIVVGIIAIVVGIFIFPIMIFIGGIYAMMKHG